MQKCSEIYVKTLSNGFSEDIFYVVYGFKLNLSSGWGAVAKRNINSISSAV